MWRMLTMNDQKSDEDVENVENARGVERGGVAGCSLEIEAFP